MRIRPINTILFQLPGWYRIVRRAVPIQLEPAERAALLELASRPETRPRVARRAQVVLRAAAGESNDRIARALHTSRPTVGLWRRRFAAQGLLGISEDAARPGRPPTVPAATVQVVLRSTIGRRPAVGRFWSARSLAQDVGVSKSTVQRIWKSRGIDPRRPAETFPAPRRRDFLERVTDMVGVYLDPPERAIALATGERARGSPLIRGERQMLEELRERNRGAEFRAFLQTVERETPPGLDVHLLVDQRLSPSPPVVERWLVRHPRVHLHFLPPDRFGQTMIDRLVAEFSRPRRRAGMLPGVSRLRRAIRERDLVTRTAGGPFVWVANRYDVRGVSGRPALLKETNGTSSI
ncbi:MAG TPA: helix-turn-helix domain-containing protein [Thermoplasmata archaeon]|nr:helix-turn-helix domain-containing protein [Thermoplasmata archaeon]